MCTILNERKWISNFCVFLSDGKIFIQNIFSICIIFMVNKSINKKKKKKKSFEHTNIVEVFLVNFFKNINMLLKVLITFELL